MNKLTLRASTVFGGAKWNGPGSKNSKNQARADELSLSLVRWRPAAQRTNNGDGTFTHATPLSNILVTSHVSLADYSNDGYINVYGYRARELDAGGPRLYTNNAGTGWTDDSAKFQATDITPAWVHKGTTWADLNGDGR